MSLLVVALKHRYSCRMRTVWFGKAGVSSREGSDSILRIKGLHVRESRNILGWYSNAWGKCVNPGSQQAGEGDTGSPDQPPISSRTDSSTWHGHGFAWINLGKSHPVSLWGPVQSFSMPCLDLLEPLPQYGATALIASVWLCAAAPGVAAAGTTFPCMSRWLCPDCHPVPGLGRAQSSPEPRAPALVYPCGRLPTAATCASRSDLC